MDFSEKLKQYKAQGNLRSLRDIDTILATKRADGSMPVNLSSNDYLALAADEALRSEFLLRFQQEELRLSASSSRLMTGNSSEYISLERCLREAYGAEAALVVGCGYHANTGILPAICDDATLILADKLVHASLIDGIRLSRGKAIRFQHNNLKQLERLIAQYHDQFETIIVVTESIFSMDGDEADIRRLVELKRLYPKVMLYIDEAHAVGVRGERGLGCCEELGLMGEIDLLMGTFGKALGSTGAYLICSQLIYNYLVNTMRTLIFTTALPPVNLAWTELLFSRQLEMGARRVYLKRISSLLHDFMEQAGQPKISSSHIVPYLIGDSARAVAVAEELQQLGFYILPVRPPTVPEGSSRLRISLCSNIEEEQILKLIDQLKVLSV